MNEIVAPDFSILKQPIEACAKCGICQQCRSPYMLGRGKWSKPKLMIISEAPGEQEDFADMALIGPAGALLDKMLTCLQIDKTDIYYSQAVRGRPPGNKMYDKYIGYCSPYIRKEIELVQPTVIITLGNSALKSLTGEGSITINRGSIKKLNDIPIVPTYSPSKYLRSSDQNDYDLMLQDIKKAWDLANGAAEPTKMPVNYRIVRNLEQLIEMYNECMAAPILSCDIETSGLSPHSNTAKVVCIQFSATPYTGWLVPIQHAECFDLPNCVACVKDILTKHTGLIGHHLKFDWKYIEHVLRFRPALPVADTMVMHHLLYEEESKIGMLKLKSMAQRYTDLGNYAPDDSDEFFASLPTMPLDQLVSYACSDVDTVQRVYLQLKPLIDTEGNLAQALRYEMIKQMLCADMERRGACINWEYHAYLMEEFPKRISKELDIVRSFSEVLDVEDQLVEEYVAKHLANKHKTIKTEITQERLDAWAVKAKEKAIAEIRFNPKSPDQLRKLMVDRLGLPEIVFTDSGEPSCGKDARGAWLMALKGKGIKADIINAVAEYLIAHSTYSFVKQYGEHKADDGKLHCNYNTCTAVTFRLSSSGVNLQNLPRDDESQEKKEQGLVGKGDIKRLFIVPHQGWKLYEPDGKQIELVIAGLLSQDPEMLHAFSNGIDLHYMLASKVYGKPACEVSDKERTEAKKANFGALYGISPGQLSLKNKIPLDTAKAFIEEFWRTFKGFQRWVLETQTFARLNGYVDCPLGHRRHLPAAQSADQEARSEALRQAVNTPIQNTASNIIIYAASVANNIFRQLKLQAYIFGQVHDSVWVASPEEEEALALGIVMYCIENMPFDFLHGRDERYPVPLRIQAGIKSGINLCDTAKTTVKLTPEIAAICRPHLDLFLQGKILT